ncbi:MAG: ankyrin repeat domain-containing protein [Salinivenus sp.]
MIRLASARALVLLAALPAATLLLAGCQSEGDGPSSPESSSAAPEQTARSADDDTSSSPQVSVRALIQAARNGKRDRVRRAVTEAGLDAGASDQRGNTPLMLAAYNGHTAVVEFLLGRGAPIDARNREGRTALMFAATGPFPETVSLLLKQGAAPNATDKAEGWSPLMFAAAEGNREVARHLLEHGADPTLTDRDGETARTFAANGGHSAVVSLLSEAE